LRYNQFSKKFSKPPAFSVKLYQFNRGGLM
jgi:hypothetical protein